MKGETTLLWTVGGVGLAVGALALIGAATMSARGADIADARDVEALARMLASENPRGSSRLWVAQIWTQIASRRKGQSLYERITGGAGFGPQDSQRPVSTENAASESHRMVVRLALLGAEVSALKGARKFFEPSQQNRMFAAGEKARAKKASGEDLTERERRALKYQHDAASLRRKWSSEGSRFVGEIDGVEFWT